MHSTSQGTASNNTIDQKELEEKEETVFLARAANSIAINPLMYGSAIAKLKGIHKKTAHAGFE
jgi:hypothetical protein